MAKTITSICMFCLLSSLLSLNSCIELEDDGSKPAYYNFTLQDLNKLPSYSINQKLVFKNQKGEEISYTASSVNKQKKLYTVGMGFFTPYAASYFYYNIMEVEFERKTPEYFYSWELIFQRMPTDFELAKTNYRKKYPSEFEAKILSFPSWNGTNSIDIESYTETVNLNISGTNFSNVKVLRSNKDQATSTNGGLLHNVTVIYYDYKIGVLGYDDLDGNQWRLKI